MTLTIGEQRRQAILRDFVGRDEEKRVFREALRALCESRIHDPARLLLVSGLGGFGKSWLLVQFEQICEQEEVYWVGVDAKHPQFEPELAGVCRKLLESHRGTLIEA